MAVPTAVPTSIRYKEVDYAIGTPIVFTELHPSIEVTFDGTDWTQVRMFWWGGSTWQSGYVYGESRGEAEIVSTTQARYKVPVHVDISTFYFQPYNSDGAGTAQNWDATVNLTTGSSYSWQHLGSVVLKDTLVANLEASELATIQQTISSIEHTKIFWEGVEDQFNQPYIMLQHMSGGATNRSQAKEADMTWRVAVQTGTLAEAMAMEEAINKALEYEYPVVNFSGVSGIGVIEEILPITDRYTLSNEDVYLSGGIYRLRLIKE